MKQIGLFNTDWKDILICNIESIIKAEELPGKSLQLIENYGKDKNKVTSYSISIAKPDYPKGTNPNGVNKNSLINIRVGKDSEKKRPILLFSLPNGVAPKIARKYPNVSMNKKKSDPITRASIEVNSEVLESFSYDLIKTVLESFFEEGRDTFGCCHLYEKCSDAKKCLHENKLYARGCTYRRHLSEGRIFYGKNRTV